MRVVIQRVSAASVSVDGLTTGEIGGGVCVFLGIAKGDSEKDADYLADKVAHLRIFEDAHGKMNRSLSETGGGALIVSEFTLYGDCRRGRRPSFDRALSSADAERLYDYFIARVRWLGVGAESGKFRSTMKVRLINDGPVTLILESPC